MSRGNIIPIRLQKIIMWIPFVNTLNLFIFIYNSYIMNWRGKRFLIGLLILILSVLIVSIIYKLFCLFFLNESLTHIITMIYIFSSGLTMGYTLVKYQVKLLKSGEND